MLVWRHWCHSCKIQLINQLTVSQVAFVITSMISKIPTRKRLYLLAIQQGFHQQFSYQCILLWELLVTKYLLIDERAPTPGTLRHPSHLRSGLTFSAVHRGPSQLQIEGQRVWIGV